MTLCMRVCRHATLVEVEGVASRATSLEADEEEGEGEAEGVTEEEGISNAFRLSAFATAGALATGVALVLL